MGQLSTFLQRKNIVISAKRYGVDALGAMAQGLFCSLLIGTILDTLGDQLGLVFLVEVGGYCSVMSGAAMAVAIGYALQAPPMVLFSLVTVGYAANALGSTTLDGGSGAGGPLAVLFIAVIAAELGKAVSKETKIDLLVTPMVTILSGVALALADYAITLTLTQLPEISAVSVTVRGQPLAYRDRQIFTARDVLFSSNEDVIDTLNATLYFLDETGGLTPVEMTLDLYEGDTQAGAVVKALLEGTEEKDWLSAIPEGFQVTSVRLEESTCYVDLPPAALPGLPEEADLSLALRALADSLLSLRAVEEVRYLVDGEFASAYGGAAVLEPYLSAA